MRAKVYLTRQMTLELSSPTFRPSGNSASPSPVPGKRALQLKHLGHIGSR
jgi:hypothetical protein